MNQKKLGSSLLLILTALIWGVAFVAQSVGMDYVGPFTFNAVRSLIGGLVLIPCIFLLDRIEARKEKKAGRQEKISGPEERKMLLTGGVCCGVCLAAASSLQQIGIVYTTVGKAGFITALYIIIVPVIGLCMGKRAPALVWVSAGAGLAGMYLLCMGGAHDVNRGDILVLLSSVCFAVHILVIDYFSPYVNGVKMSCIQFFTCGLLCAIPMLLAERPSLAAIAGAWAPVLYAGVLSCGVAYTLQIIGQKGVSPVAASLILSLESVFSVLAGWALLGQRLTDRELLGCVLVFAGIILVQVSPEKPGEKERKR